jgi:hypothetical protein
MQVTGYKYITEQDAINAREQVDAYYGIPISPDDVTQNWTDFQIAELNNPIFWYIVYDISLEIVLGQPISFDVITEVN